MFYFVTIFFVTEYLLSKFFDDEIVQWKIIAVCLISATVLSYKVFKITDYRGLKSILNYQTETIKINEAISDQLIQKIKIDLAKNNFTKIKDSENGLKFRTKKNYMRIGIKFTLTCSESSLLIKSKPVFFTHIVDENFRANENFTKIRNIINLNLNENDKSNDINCADTLDIVPAS